MKNEKAKEQSMKNEKAKEQSAKNQKVKEQSMKEQSMKNEKAKEQSMKNEKAKEQSAKNEKAKEQAVKKQEADAERKEKEEVEKAQEEKVKAEKQEKAEQAAEKKAKEEKTKSDQKEAEEKKKEEEAGSGSGSDSGSGGDDLPINIAPAKHVVRDTSTAGEGCIQPVVFYSDCTFRTVVSSVAIKEGMTLEKITGSPKAVVVPVGCRVSLFSKTSLSFTSRHPSQALVIKGDGAKRCLSSGEITMDPVAIEINHDIDHAKMAKEVKDLKNSMQHMMVRPHVHDRRL